MVPASIRSCCRLFFLTATAPTDIYTLSLHDALPILSSACVHGTDDLHRPRAPGWLRGVGSDPDATRSEEHTSELQSHHDLVCRLLLEKKKHLSLWTRRDPRRPDPARPIGRPGATPSP